MVEPTGDAELPEGFVDLTPREEAVLADAEAGNLPDHDADATEIGPDEEEQPSASDAEDRLELPEADEEFDEDLSDLLAEITVEAEEPV